MTSRTFRVILEDILDPEVRLFLEEVHAHIHFTTHSYICTLSLIEFKDVPILQVTVSLLK